MVSDSRRSGGAPGFGFRRFRLASLLVFVDPDLPGGSKGAEKKVFIRRAEPNMRGAVAAPAAGNGQKDIRSFGDELGLDIGREHQVSVPLFFRGERGEDAAANTEIRRAEVGAFFSAFKAECDAAEIGGCHLIQLQHSMIVADSL